MSRMFVRIHSDEKPFYAVVCADKELTIEVERRAGLGDMEIMDATVRFPLFAVVPTVELNIGEDVVESSGEVSTCKK